MHTSYSPFKAILLILLFIGGIVILYSCVKEEGQVIESPYPTYIPSSSKEVIITSIYGRVVDEDDLPVSNAEVYLKVMNTFEKKTTDSNGSFYFLDAEVTRDGAFLKVVQEGKFEALRKMNVTESSNNRTTIKLLDKTIVGMISSMSGGTVYHPSNAQLDLPSNGIQYENGSDYVGEVAIAMSWIDPTAEDLFEKMVGDLSGRAQDGEHVVLGTFGMLNVELLGDNGELLQLKEGKSATLSFPVPTEILSQAPPTIPLWYYDETLETWVEEGSATLEGDTYVGTVGHFSSWNVDAKGERIVVKGNVLTIVNNEEMSLEYLQVHVHIDEIKRVGGFLDNDGAFEFYNFPANTPFVLTFSDACNKVVMEETLGPFADDTDLGTIEIDSAHVFNFVKVRKQCNGDHIKDGYGQFLINGWSREYPMEENGMFELETTLCNDDRGTLTVIDVFNRKMGSQIIDFEGTNGLVEIGSLATCEDIEFYVDVKINGNDSLFFANPQVGFTYPPIGNKGFYVTTRRYISNRGYYYFQISIPDITGIGTYESFDIRWYGFSPMLPNGQEGYTLPNETTILEITKYGESSGDIIEGNFMSSAEPEWEPQVDGSFRAIRE